MAGLAQGGGPDPLVASAARLLLRLLLGGCFLYAGLVKASHLADFMEAIAHYQLLPGPLVAVTSVGVVGLEIVAGGSLVLGFLTESAALLLGMLSFALAAAVASALLRGLDIPCGCFDRLSDPVSWSHVAFNGALLLLSFVLLRQGAGDWSVDRWLGLKAPIRRFQEAD